MTEKRGSKRGKSNHKASSTKKSHKKHKKTVKKSARHAKKVKKKVKTIRKTKEGDIRKAEKGAVKEGKKIEHELEEEFLIPSPRHIGKYMIPMGIKFLIAYLILIATLYIVSFVSGLSFPTTILFGKLVTGWQALVLNSLLLILIFFMIYGFWKRKFWTFDLAISFFSISALNSLLSATLFSAEIASFRKLMMLSFVSLMIMNVIVVWYILHERKYFYAKKFHDRPIQHRDKLFVYTIVTFWLVALMIGGTLGAQFYKDSKAMVDKSVSELRGNLYQGEDICAKEKGAQRDVCYLVLATAKQMQGVSEPGLCENIESDLYKMSCEKSTKTTMKSEV